MEHTGVGLRAVATVWPPGDYRVDLFIDGEPAGTRRFSVKP